MYIGYTASDCTYNHMSHHSISIVNPLKVLSGFMFVLPQRDSSGRRVIFHIPRSSILVFYQLLKLSFQCLPQQELLHHQTFGHISPLHGGRDQSHCYYFGNPFGGRREPNKACNGLVPFISCPSVQGPLLHS